MTDDLTPDTDASTEHVLDDAPATEGVDVLADEAVVDQADAVAAVAPEVDEVVPASDDDVADAEAHDADIAPEAADEVLGEVVDEDALLEPEPAPAPRESPYDRPGRWYVVHSYAGYEKKVKADLENRTSAMNMEEKIYEVVIPTEEVDEIKGGKKVRVEKKMFPGYLLVRCDLDDDSWFVIRNTPGITGFVGPGTKPTPLSRKEVETFLQTPVEGEEDTAAAARKPRTTHGYAKGEPVRVLTGPFADFPGMISEINEDKQEVTVLVDIFGRETPVKLGFGDITKL